MAITSKQIAICDTEAELTALVPVAGQKAVALDTGNKFIGNGVTFDTDTSDTKGTASGDLRGTYPSPKIRAVAVIKYGG